MYVMDVCKACGFFLDKPKQVQPTWLLKPQVAITCGCTLYIVMVPCVFLYSFFFFFILNCFRLFSTTKAQPNYFFLHSHQFSSCLLRLAFTNYGIIDFSVFYSFFFFSRLPYKWPYISAIYKSAAVDFHRNNRHKKLRRWNKFEQDTPLHCTMKWIASVYVDVIILGGVIVLTQTQHVRGSNPVFFGYYFLEMVD